MSHDQRYESWKKASTAVEVPDDFADAVMNRIDEYRQERRTLAAAVYLQAALSSKWGRIAMCTAAGVACAIRMGSFLSLLFASH